MVRVRGGGTCLARSSIDIEGVIYTLRWIPQREWIPRASYYRHNVVTCTLSKSGLRHVCECGRRLRLTLHSRPPLQAHQQNTSPFQPAPSPFPVRSSAGCAGQWGQRDLEIRREALCGVTWKKTTFWQRDLFIRPVSLGFNYHRG